MLLTDLKVLLPDGTDAEKHAYRRLGSTNPGRPVYGHWTACSELVLG